MDSIFLLGEAERAALLQHMMQSFGCTYICLWSYLPLPSNCLLYLDGVYKEESNQLQAASSSSGTNLARMLFNAYCELVNYVDHGRVPGFAFKNNISYLEMKLDALQRLASSEVQMQFYQEAGIQTVVFMGCAMGELELGLSSEPQVNLEMEMKSWFPTNLSTQTPPTMEQLPQTPNQNTPSSSLISLSSSLNSVEHSSSIFDIPTRSHDDNLRSHAMAQIQNVQFPTTESENDTMTKAILAVLTSASSADHEPISHDEPAAFRRYRGDLATRLRIGHRNRQSMFKRAVLFFRNLNNVRRHELRVRESIEPTTMTSAQLQHMISERRRREKINESFQVLRSLLPPGSKKDKVSVLSNTTEFITSLRSEMEQLRKRNQTLETQLFSTSRIEPDDHLRVGSRANVSSSTDDQRVAVEIERVSPSTSEARFLEVRVSLRSSGESRPSDLVIRVLEVLKEQRDVIRLLSIQSNTRVVESSVSVHGLVLRLKIEGDDEFDETGFREAVRRVVDDRPR